MDTSPVTAVRRFNRFYTSAIGVLDRRYLGSPYTVAEGRVLYEVATAGEGVTPKAVSEITRIDPGYLSRILGRLERDGMVARRRSASDGRSVELSLTPEGVKMFSGFNLRSAALVEDLIEGLTPDERRRLVDAVETAQALLGKKAPPAPIVLREPRPGDMGWVTERHGVIYGREYGWGSGIEAVTARICADFLEAEDQSRQRCWIAERAGERLGCVFMVQESEGVARLRLLLLEPGARGTGLGRRLVEEGIAFARATGYREVVLWTHAVLTAARRIYASTGFEIVETWTHDEFGKPEVSETWRLVL